MGMLDKMIKGAVKAAKTNNKQPKAKKQKEPPKAIYKAWETAPFKGVYRLPPDHESSIYTYDGTPFNGMKVGTKFVIAAVPGYVQMTSIYTGTTTEIGDFGNIAYSYNGYIFGFASSHAEAIVKMMKAGYRVELEAYISGYDGQQGFPMVKGLFGYIDDSTYMNI